MSLTQSGEPLKDTALPEVRVSTHRRDLTRFPIPGYANKRGHVARVVGRYP